MEQPGIQPRSLKGEILAWALSIFVSVICLFVGFAFLRATPSFRELFKGLGVELPLPTKILIMNYSWLCPLLFGGVAVALIVKEFIMRGTTRRLVATGILFLVAISLSEALHYVLYLPLLDLIQKLNQAK